MKDRLKQIRKELKLTQKDFSDRLGIQRNAIANCESGRAELSGAVISLICRTYNVNEAWLRTGKGEMFATRTRDEEIAAYFGRLMGGKCSAIENAIISLMARATPEDWELIEGYARELAAALEEKEKPDQT